MPTCLMTNCNREAPADEAMCAEHRDSVSDRFSYRKLRDRLIEDLLVDVPQTPNYGRLIVKPPSRRN